MKLWQSEEPIKLSVRGNAQPMCMSPMNDEERLLMQQIAYSGDQSDAFLTCDKAKIKREVEEWTQGSPNLKPSFDVFNNGQELVLQTLQGQGCTFICKNREEITRSSDAGIEGTDIIFENEMLVNSHLKFAAKAEVGAVVCRKVADLSKVKKCYPTSSLLLSIDWSSLDDFDRTLEHVLDLIQKCSDLDLVVSGLFLSGSFPAEAGTKALAHLRLLFVSVHELSINVELKRIHLGTLGGDLEQCKALTDGLSSNFPDRDRLQIEASLPANILGSAISLCVRVVGKRCYREGSQARRSYVLNEGVFGCFNQEMHDDVDTPCFHPRTFETTENEATLPCEFLGPSGDENDELRGEFHLPDLEEGEWIVFHNIGSFALGSGNPKRYEAFEAPAIWSCDKEESDLWIVMEEVRVSNEKTESRQENQGISLQQLQASLQGYTFDDVLPEMIRLSDV